jgi:hypothetical protein
MSKADKVSPQLKDQLGKLSLAGAIERIRIMVEVETQALKLGTAAGALTVQYGAEITYRSKVTNYIAMVIDSNRVDEIATQPWVKRVWHVPDVELFGIPPTPGILAADALTDLMETAAYIGVTETRAKGYDGTGLIVAIVDSGIEKTHPMLQGQVIAEKNFIGPDPGDRFGHGTWCASCVAGKYWDSPVGALEGMAPGAKLVNAKIFEGNTTTMDVAMAGLEWAASQGVHILSNSWGGSERYDPVRDLIISLKEAYNVIFVFAAGNSGPGYGTVSYPGGYPEVVCVGSIAIKNPAPDTVSEFSSRGPNWEGGVKPDIVAPGGNGFTYNEYIYGGFIGGSVRAWRGTSMATPHIAGGLALCLQAGVTVEEIYINARDIMALGKDNDSGYGVAQIYDAIYPGRLKTDIQVEIQPPEYLHRLDSFVFQGVLKEFATGKVLRGKTINLMKAGSTVPLATTTTDLNGRWSFTIALEKGIYDLYSFFPGDATYHSKLTPFYRVNVGATLVNVSTIPVPSIDPGKRFVFSGTLIDKMTGERLPDREMFLYINGQETISTTTYADGRWIFSIVLNMVGEYLIGATFKGDEGYMGIRTDDYRVMVGLPMIFGNDKRTWAYAWPKSYLEGSAFVCPNDGVALSITAWCRDQNPAGTKRAKCAIYRYSDNTLVGQTQELTGLAGGDWRTFNFLDPKPALKGGEQYWLVIWFDAFSDSYFETGVLETPGNVYIYADMPCVLGSCPYTGNFPPTWTPRGGYENLQSIYCTVQSPDEQTLVIQPPVGNGMTDPAPGTYYFIKGQVVTVVANPYAGNVFDHWVLDGVNRAENPIDITMDSNHTLQAVFTPSPERTLTITSTAGGTTDPAPGSYRYTSGATAAVTAYPSASYRFDHWLLDGIIRTGSPIYILMDTDHTLNAVFVAAPVHNLSISTSTGGTTSPPPGIYTYDEGTTVRVTAYPSSGYVFDHWVLDGATITGNPIDVLMDTDHSIKAFFVLTPVQYTLTISTTVGGTTDPVPGSYLYNAGSTAVVTAYPSSGYVFDHWVLDGATITGNPISILMNGNHSIQAVFAAIPPPQYTLTITAGAGGTTDPVPGSYLYNAGTTATVTAYPSSGYQFDHWMLDGVTHTENPISILMNANHSLTAVFAVIPPVQYTLTITSGTGGMTDPAPGSYLYNAGTIARVTAYPSSGYVFDHWVLDGVTITGNPIDVLMNSNHSIQAVFATAPPTQYTLTITSGTGGTTYPPPGTYNYQAGTTASVTAYADSGYQFAHWVIDGYTSTSNPIGIVMDKNYTLHAVFEVIPAPERMLTISATEGGTTNPAPGSYYYADGSVAQAIAFPDSGYIFDHWLIDGITRATDNPISVLMDSDHTLAAVFIVAPPIPSPYRNVAIAAGVAGVAGLVYLGTRKK